MARANRRPPGLLFFVGTGILAACVGLGIGSSSAQQLTASADHQQQPDTPRKPSLKPGDIRAVLIATAKPPGPPVPDSPFGAGLVNAYRAVTWFDHTTPGNDASEQAKQ